MKHIVKHGELCMKFLMGHAIYIKFSYTFTLENQYFGGDSTRNTEIRQLLGMPTTNPALKACTMIVKLGILPSHTGTIVRGDEILRVCVCEDVHNSGVLPSGHEEPDGEVFLRACGGGMKTRATKGVTNKVEKEQKSKLT